MPCPVVPLGSSASRPSSTLLHVQPATASISVLLRMFFDIHHASALHHPPCCRHHDVPPLAGSVHYPMTSSSPTPSLVVHCSLESCVVTPAATVGSPHQHSDGPVTSGSQQAWLTVAWQAAW
ncbi:unnamed protein product [Victoria cruziana]